jgi:hypothetical protein
MRGVKENWKRRLVIGVAAVAMCLLGAWITGFNFDKRGNEATFVYLVTIILFAFGVSCPLADKD